MALTDFPGLVIEHVTGNIRRRVMGWLLVIIFALAAVYEATVAVVVALEAQVGAVAAHLIVAVFYLSAAFIAAITLWATSRSRRSSPALPHQVGALRPPADFQLVSIVEAMLFGYSLSRRK